jgi:hypothetical protein
VNNLDKDLCFICKNSVLALYGQDTFLDPYRLSRSDDDRISNEIHDANAMGNCHFLCLINSKWGHLWSEKIKEHLINTVRKQILAEVDDYIFFGSKNNFNNTFGIDIIKNNGWMSVIYARDVTKARKTNDNVFFPIISETHYDFASQVDKKEELKDIAQGGKLALLDFISVVGVKDYLLNPIAVKNGVIELVEKDSDTNSTYLMTRLSYERIIPSEIFDIVLRFVK